MSVPNIYVYASSSLPFLLTPVFLWALLQVATGPTVPMIKVSKPPRGGSSVSNPTVLDPANTPDHCPNPPFGNRKRSNTHDVGIPMSNVILPRGVCSDDDLKGKVLTCPVTFGALV